MRIFIASMPRSGSEFTVELVQKVTKREYSNRLIPITPGRNINPDHYHDSKELQNFIKIDKGIQFFSDKEDYLVKIESPGIDTLCLDLVSHFKGIKWIASIRKLEDIIISHHNLLSWGWSEDKIIAAYKNDLFFYEYVSEHGNLFLVNIDEPEKFNLSNFMKFLSIDSLTSEEEDKINKWDIVNPLNYQKKKANERIGEKSIPENLNTLRERHPWINDIENRMLRLWRKSNFNYDF